MQRQIKMKKIYLTLLALGLAYSCKPATDTSGVLDSTGTLVDWRSTVLLRSSGSMTIDTTNSDPSYALNTLQLQIVSAPDASGFIANSALVAGQYMALRMTNDDVRFNVLMTTHANSLCTDSNVLLNGTSDQVFCKTDGQVALDTNETYRSNLESICRRLSTTPQLTQATTTAVAFFASYDSTKNHNSCTCLNGSLHELTYSSYFYATGNYDDFEAACRADPADLAPSTNEATCDLLQDQYALAQGSKVTAGSDWCVCGTTQLAYDAPPYLVNTAQFRTDCTNAVLGILPTSTATGTSTVTQTYTATAQGTDTSTINGTANLGTATPTATDTSTSTNFNTGFSTDDDDGT